MCMCVCRRTYNIYTIYAILCNNIYNIFTLYLYIYSVFVLIYSFYINDGYIIYYIAVLKLLAASFVHTQANMYIRAHTFITRSISIIVAVKFNGTFNARAVVRQDFRYSLFYSLSFFLFFFYIVAGQVGL